MPRALRFAGLALALSTVAGAAWLIWASAEDGRLYIRVGFAGLLAVGLLWAARARSGRRAVGRAFVVGAALLLGSVVTYAVALSVAPDFGVWAGAAGVGAILSTSGLAGEFGPVSEWQVHSVSIALTLQEALSLGLNVGGVLLGIVMAPTLRRASGGRARSARVGAAGAMLPFATLAGAALIDGALASALLALAGGGWLAAVIVRPDGAALAPTT